MSNENWDVKPVQRKRREGNRRYSLRVYWALHTESWLPNLVTEHEADRVTVEYEVQPVPRVQFDAQGMIPLAFVAAWIAKHRTW